MADKNSAEQDAAELFRDPTNSSELDSKENISPESEPQNLPGTNRSVPEVNQNLAKPPETVPGTSRTFPGPQGTNSGTTATNPNPFSAQGTNSGTSGIFPGMSRTSPGQSETFPGAQEFIAKPPETVPGTSRTFPGPQVTNSGTAETNPNPFMAQGTNLINSSNLEMKLATSFPKSVPDPNLPYQPQITREESLSEAMHRDAQELYAAYNFPRSWEESRPNNPFQGYENRFQQYENRSQDPNLYSRSQGPHPYSRNYSRSVSDTKYQSEGRYFGKEQDQNQRQRSHERDEEIHRPRRRQNYFMQQNATDAMVRTSNTWKDVKRIEDTYNDRDSDDDFIPPIPLGDLAPENRLPTVEDVIRYHFCALLERESERNEADPNYFFQDFPGAQDKKPFGQVKNLSTPAHQIAALKGRIQRNRVTLAPTSFPGWKRYIDTMLNASYMGSLTQIKAKDVPSTPKEWNSIDSRPETLGAFYYTMEKLRNGMVPRFTPKDNIFVLNGIFRGICNFFPNAMLILQPLLVESLDPIFNYLVKDVVISETNFRNIYFSIIKKFKGATEGIVAMKIQNFLHMKYDPRNGPMAFAAELAKERVEVNELAETESLTVSMMRTTFINAIRQKTQLYNNLLDSATFVANKSLDEIVSMLERKYLEERLTNPVHQGNFAGSSGSSSGSKPENPSNFKPKPKICYQWRDYGTCSFGKECKWKEFHTEGNKKIGKASANLVSDSQCETVQGTVNDNDEFLDQFAALAKQSRARKSNANKYKKKFKSLLAKANLLKKELTKRNGRSLQESLNLAAQGKLSVDEGADIADSEQGNLLLEGYLTESDASSISSE